MDSQWLNLQFELNPKKTKAGLAKALNLEAPAISKILNGTRQIKAQEYLTMRKYFELEESADLKKPGKDPGVYTLSPLASEHQAGLDDHDPKQDQDWVIPAQVIAGRTKAPPEKIKIFQVRETLMEPDYKQGEYVLVDLSDTKPSPPGVFIISDGFGYMVRGCAFVPKSNPPEIKISAQKKDFVPQTLELEDVKILGRLIAKLQML